jgi:sulfur carrier protein
MQVIVNLKPQHTSANLLQDLILELSPQNPFGIAKNGAFIPKKDYVTTPLSEGDRIEIISPVTGG